MNQFYYHLEKHLGHEVEDLLTHKAIIPKESLHLPGPDWIDRIFVASDRNNRVLQNLQRLFTAGRLKDTGYLSLLPVDQGVEHSAGASFSSCPDYFDPEQIVQLALEGGCSGLASTLGTLAIVSRKYAHKIPFILKINHNELLTYPEIYDQTLFSSVKQAYDMGCVGVGATIYFGSDTSRRQIQEISEAFEQAHDLGLLTILWCYLRNPFFKSKDKDYHEAADLTGQANYLGSTIKADIVKQKSPECNKGYHDLKFGRSHPFMYDKLCSDHPIDLTRYQLFNQYAGRIGLINSGGASGRLDEKDILRTAIINKRAGGMGLISGRKVFQKPFKEGVRLLNLLQDVYLSKEISIA
ncbi:MAG: class I fructose-bisphosphate aldolase [Rhabdochlamydiaceae bacterium]